MIRYINLIVLGLSLWMPLMAAEKALTNHDEGRLVVLTHVREGNSPFMVFHEVDRSGKYYCVPLGSKDGVLLNPQAVTVLPFHKNVPADTVSFYAVYHMSLNPRNLLYAELSRYYPGQRNDTLAAMIAATRLQMNELLALNTQLLTAEAQMKREFAFSHSPPRRPPEQLNSPDILKNEILTKIEDGEPIQLIMGAIMLKDFYLAVGLYEYYCQDLRYLSQAAGKGSLADDINKYITINRDGLVKEYRMQRQAVTSVREREFSRLCPDAFGQWKKSAPVSYNELLQIYAQCFKSYMKLDSLSPNADFPEWGSAMLDVLLLLPDSAAGEALEKEFDQALERYKNRIKK